MTESSPAASGLTRNARLGLILFFIYLAIYVGFIVLSAFARNLMRKPSLGGMNLAVVYGFGLIIGAFVLALIYMLFCNSDPAPGPELTEGALAGEFEKEEGGA